ncbi:hypothetical protein [Leptospira noguchii]|uniref:hypothetical protein n=1 Tax=Leptospira noguchii TaxID=28182 RepID=UPI003D76943B
MLSSGSETLSSGKRCALVSNTIRRERCAEFNFDSKILWGWLCPLTPSSLKSLRTRTNSKKSTIETSVPI